MLTKRDIFLLKEAFKEDFVTRAEFNEFREEMRESLKEMRHDMLQFKDDILWEIKGMREELMMVAGHRQIIEDHEVRIDKLEKNPALALT